MMPALTAAVAPDNPDGQYVYALGTNAAFAGFSSPRISEVVSIRKSEEDGTSKGGEISTMESKKRRSIRYSLLWSDEHERT